MWQQALLAYAMGRKIVSGGRQLAVAHKSEGIESLTLERFRAAQAALRPYLYQSPLLKSDFLSDRCGCAVYIKAESFLPTHAFKVRGAINRLLAILESERSRGVVTASAGNHGMGVAYGARLFSIPATIVVPEHANETKVDAIKHMDAEVIRHGETYQEAYDEARRIEKERHATFVHAFDDADVISGQATIALELMQQHPEVNAILVPVGGGGLIGGIAAAVKQVNPRITVIGVQAEGAPSMQRALATGSIADVQHIDTIADGLATTHVGELTFALAKKYVDEMVLVSDHEMLKAIHYLLEHEHLLSEPAGAAACAALMFKKKFRASDEVVILLTGANISVPVLRDAVAFTE